VLKVTRPPAGQIKLGALQPLSKAENMPEVLKIPMYDQGFEQAVAELLRVCQSPSQPRVNRLVSATGAHGLVFAQKNPDFATTLKNFYMNLPDGMPSVWVGRGIKGAKQMERCRGADYFKAVLVRSAATPIRHFLCGGKEGVADRLKQACEVKFSSAHCVGTYCPPFRQMTDLEMRELGDQITASGADVVWIGLSTPKQELFAKRLAAFIQTHFIVTVGAVFDFHTDGLTECPIVLQKIGMEWFFRLWMEPKRLFRRYLEIVPAFIFYNIRELYESHF
jgi:N-acetylglucosaminyldiphosphoundecaprenol N-acetyl-beta-D-mannosaminyltransferase